MILQCRLKSKTFQTFYFLPGCEKATRWFFRNFNFISPQLEHGYENAKHFKRAIDLKQFGMKSGARPCNDFEGLHFPLDKNISVQHIPGYERGYLLVFLK